MSLQCVMNNNSCQESNSKDKVEHSQPGSPLSSEMNNFITDKFPTIDLLFIEVLLNMKDEHQKEFAKLNTTADELLNNEDFNQLWYTFIYGNHKLSETWKDSYENFVDKFTLQNLIYCIFGLQMKNEENVGRVVSALTSDLIDIMYLHPATFELHFPDIKNENDISPLTNYSSCSDFMHDTLLDLLEEDNEGMDYDEQSTNLVNNLTKFLNHNLLDWDLIVFPNHTRLVVETYDKDYANYSSEH